MTYAEKITILDKMNSLLADELRFTNEMPVIKLIKSTINHSNSIRVYLIEKESKNESANAGIARNIRR